MLNMAGRTGLEPATFAVTVRCSSQLNYRPTHILEKLPDYTQSLLLSQMGPNSKIFQKCVSVKETSIFTRSRFTYAIMKK